MLGNICPFVCVSYFIAVELSYLYRDEIWDRRAIMYRRFLLDLLYSGMFEVVNNWDMEPSKFSLLDQLYLSLLQLF